MLSHSGERPLPAIEAHLPHCVLLRSAELDQCGAGGCIAGENVENVTDFPEADVFPHLVGPLGGGPFPKCVQKHPF